MMKTEHKLIEITFRRQRAIALIRKNKNITAFEKVTFSYVKDRIDVLKPINTSFEIFEGAFSWYELPIFENQTVTKMVYEVDPLKINASV